MTDRIRTLTVVLEEECRDDDVTDYVTAIKMIRGVQSVMLGEPVDISSRIASQDAKSELRRKMWDILTD